MNKTQFLGMATLFEGGLLLLALGLGKFFEIDPLATLHGDPESVFLAVAATVPLYGFLRLTHHIPSLRVLRDLLIDRLGQLLASMSRLELLYLGFLAGTTEEILFRGFLQPWLEEMWGSIGGLLFSNMIFALLHWITPVYGLVAGLLGGYLGFTMDLGPERNLTVPLLVHALYDFLALQAVASLWRQAEIQRAGYPERD
jgi:membrane protease YdiL (CAAX protease family)